MTRGLGQVLVAGMTAFLLATAQPHAVAAAAVPYTIGNELLMRSYEWHNALTGLSDRATLNDILADEFVFTDTTGKTYNKARYITAVRVSEYSLTKPLFSASADKITLTAPWTGKRTIDGKDASGTFQVTQTWVKRDGRWQAVALQETHQP